MTTENTERDELTESVRLELRHGNYQMPDDSLPYESQARSLADAILAAGYTKPRQVTTVEELDALPVGAVIKDRDRDVCQRFRGGWRATIHEPTEDPWLTDTLEVDLPATILYSPVVGA